MRCARVAILLAAMGVVVLCVYRGADGAPPRAVSSGGAAGTSGPPERLETRDPDIDGGLEAGDMELVVTHADAGETGVKQPRGAWDCDVRLMQGRWGKVQAEGAGTIVVVNTAEVVAFDPVVADEPDSHALEAPSEHIDAWLMGGGSDRPGLVVLDLGRSDLTDLGLAYLRVPPTLRKLSVRYTGVTDIGIARLCEAESVDELNIGGTKVTDAGLAALGNLPDLHTLYVWQTAVTDAGLAQIGRLRRLQSLYIGSVAVSGWGLRHLRSLPRLRTLWLENSQLDDAGAAEIGALLSLEDISLENTRIGDASIPHLLRLPHLRRLCISGTAVTDDGEALLSRAFPGLELIR